ncbi:MAG: hypothetical protein KGJ84_05145 [Elusimicrobia bacterium]|nr:hypothetical protein [Elusimicrobiota bacterium]
MLDQHRVGRLLRAAVLAAAVCAPAGAQLRAAPCPIVAPAVSGPAAQAFAVPPLAAAPPSAVFFTAAPTLAVAALPAAAAAASVPDARSADLGPPTEPRDIVLGDPAAAADLLSSSKKLWGAVPPSVKHLEKEYRAAVEAADHTYARAAVAEAVEGARKELGRRAFTHSTIRREAADLRAALARPDHPAVAAAHEGFAAALALEKENRAGPAMEKIMSVLREYADSPVIRTAHKWALMLPMIRLQTRLRERGFDVYETPREARVLGVEPSADGVAAWIKRRRAADRDSVVGTYRAEPIGQQSSSDCALHALWNLPVLRGLRTRTTYEGFAAAAEKIADSPIKREGLSESQSKLLLAKLGFERSHDRAPAGEDDLARMVADNGGVLAGYDFPMKGWKALLALGSLKGRYAHAVAITAAVRERGRWWFVVVDSAYLRPRLLSYGELLTLGLKIAIVKPRA